jgi:hypothetical protein
MFPKVAATFDEGQFGGTSSGDDIQTAAARQRQYSRSELYHVTRE